VKDGDRKQGEFKCRATVPGRRENTKPGAEMTGSVGEHVTDSSQPCRKGAIRGNITALEAVYDGCRIDILAHVGFQERSPQRIVRKVRTTGQVARKSRIAYVKLGRFLYPACLVAEIRQVPHMRHAEEDVQARRVEQEKPPNVYLSRVSQARLISLDLSRAGFQAALVLYPSILRAGSQPALG